MPTRVQRALLALVVALLAAMSFGNPARASVVTIVAGTEVKVHVVDKVSSATAKPGDSVAVVAAQQVVVQGLQVVLAGAAGQGHVVAATPLGSHGKRASITIALDWIQAVDGQQLGLAATAGGAANLVFSSTGPFAKTFPKDKEITLTPDFVFSVYTKDERTVHVVTGNGY